jgi:hypothetical protein
MLKDKMIRTIKISVLALVLAIGTGYAFANTNWSWVPPQGPPENNNVAPPVNVRGVSQANPGLLRLLVLVDSNEICLGGVTPEFCRSTWPAGGGGSSNWTVSGNNIHSSNSGNVGIGTNLPQSKLHVNGTVRLQNLPQSTETSILVRDGAGNLGFRAPGDWTNGGGFGQPSDAFLKTNLSPISEGMGALERISMMSGLFFNWNDLYKSEFGERDYKKRQIGFIAQEVERVLPELVTSISVGESEYKAVDYAKMTPLLVEAIKEQQRMIEDQQRQIDELKALIK